MSRTSDSRSPSRVSLPSMSQSSVMRFSSTPYTSAETKSRSRCASFELRSRSPSASDAYAPPRLTSCRMLSAVCRGFSCRSTGRFAGAGLRLCSCGAGPAGRTVGRAKRGLSSEAATGFASGWGKAFCGAGAPETGFASGCGKRFSPESFLSKWRSGFLSPKRLSRSPNVFSPNLRSPNFLSPNFFSPNFFSGFLSK